MHRERKSKAELEAFYTAEAIRLIGDTPKWQRRMFRIAFERGLDSEPTGLLAGSRPLKN